MSSKQTKLACRRPALAAAVFLAAQFFALHDTARAQMSGPATQTSVAVGPSAAAKPIVGTAPAVSATCTARAELARFDRPLIHTMRRLAEGQPLTVVAIGSSSTAGAGASSPDATYPSRLAVELRARFPSREITVLNRGVNGEETNNMMARFPTDVLAAHPQLVLWQIGTNSVLRDHPLNPHAVQLHDGIERLKAAGADVVLIDPQFAPAVLAKSGNARHGRADRACREGRGRRSVPALRRDARVARCATPVVRYVRIAGPSAHERLELRLPG